MYREDNAVVTEVIAIIRDVILTVTSIAIIVNEVFIAHDARTEVFSIAIVLLGSAGYFRTRTVVKDNGK